MKRLLILSVFVLAAVGQDVQHAPTVAQCQADQRLWLSTIEEGDPPKLPRMPVIAKWNTEMLECERVDPDNMVKYYNTHGEIEAQEIDRMRNTFLTDTVCGINSWTKTRRANVKAWSSRRTHP